MYRDILNNMQYVINYYSINVVTSLNTGYKCCYNMIDDFCDIMIRLEAKIRP